MINIYLADLNHARQNYIAFPYQVGLVASYALNDMADRVSIELFKNFDEFREAVESRKPDVVGLTNYMWNSRLSSLTAELIRRECPATVCIMGGPNYYDEAEMQAEFLQRNPAVDFYVYKEGEVAFTSLIKHLIHADWDIEKLKSSRIEIPSVHYLYRGELIRGQLISRIKNLDEIPSPYLTGIMDKFFEQDVNVLIQRTRGCPFSCTFCGEGTEYYNKVARFSTGRFGAELVYCAERLKNKEGRSTLMHIADANFGMFPEDLLVAEQISAVRREYGWPRKIEVPTGKNKKEQVLKVINKINEGIKPIVRLTASVQSTNEQVLKYIKRSNIAISSLINNAKEKEKEGTTLAYGEVILALPGDSFGVHTKSIKDLIDEGIQKISHQYLTLLPGTEMASLENREMYGVRSAFRIMPGAYGRYQWGGNEFQWFETEERAIANNSLSFDDYLKCVEYDLVIETFYNDNLFDEYTGLLKFLGLPISSYMDEIFALRSEFPPGLDKVFREFVAGRKNELLDNNGFLIEKCSQNPHLIEELIEHENKISLGNTRSGLIFSQMEALHTVANRAMITYLRKSDKYEGNIPEYLREASLNSYFRKEALLDDRVTRRTLHYDFLALHELTYNTDHAECFVPEGIDILYKPNAWLKSRHDYFSAIEPNQVMRWRKLLYETRIDRNDEWCRVMEIDRNARSVISADELPKPLFVSAFHPME